MNRIKSLSLVVLAALTTVAFAQPAHALVNVSAVGSFNITNPKLDPSNALVTAGNGFGGGALISFPLMTAFELETGLLYTPFVTHIGLAPLEANLTQKYLVIPVIARFTLLPLISFGAGISYGIKSGDLTSDNSLFSTAGMSAKNNLGLTGSIALRLPLAPAFGILVDARYTLGLTDQDDSASSQKFNQIQILAGLNFKL